MDLKIAFEASLIAVVFGVLGGVLFVLAIYVYLECSNRDLR